MNNSISYNTIRKNKTLGDFEEEKEAKEEKHGRSPPSAPLEKKSSQ